jgi:uncharacterized protein YqjF (DUF2071 family)
MIYWLRRHPIPISAFFRHSLVLTYALKPEVLTPLLPEGLVLDTFRGFGFLAVALVQTERLRPSFLPAAVGGDFFLSGYRVFTRLAQNGQGKNGQGEGGQNGVGQSKRGLRILRSDTDHPWMVRAGNLLTHYNYRLCRAKVKEDGQQLHWTVRTPDAEADLDVTARLAARRPTLPEGSPFQTLSEARRFAGPLPYTFDYEEETHSIVAIRAVRQNWNPEPVPVEVWRNTFLEHEPFRGAAAVLANAFYVHDVPYAWQRGRRLP